MNQQMMMRLRKMQKELEEAQARLAETIFEGSAGGIVTVEVKGNHTVVNVKINPEAIESKDDLELVGDCISSAINDANKKIEEAQKKLLGPAAGALGGMF